MEHAKLSLRSLGRKNSGGMALVLVLMLVVLTTIMMLAFFLSVQTESKSMRSVVSGQNSRQLADIAVQNVISQIQQATTQGTKVAWASQPGMIRCYDNVYGDPPVGWYKLYSASTNVVTPPAESSSSFQSYVGNDVPTQAWATPGSPNYGVYTDINSPVFSSDGTLTYPIVNPNGATSVATANNTTNTAVLGFNIATANTPGYTTSGAAGSNASPTNNPAAMPVLWIYVLRDGTQVPAVASGTPGTVQVQGASSSNPIVGRIAYWTDDETCKINVNTAADGTYYDTPRFCSTTANTSLSTVTPTSTQDADIVIDRQMALTPPVAGEFQRYIGGPAQTKLSYVLGSSIINSGNVNKSNLMTLLSPFMQWGGSDGGTLTTWNGSTSNTLTTPQRQTPYASLDEWMFSNQQLASNNRVPNPATVANTGALLTNTNLQQLRFFLSANSDAPEVNLFGQPRISMWPIYTANLANNVPPASPSNYLTPFDQMIANAATLTPSSSTPYTYYFGRQNAASPTVDWGGTSNNAMSLLSSGSNTRNQNIFIFLRTLAKNAIPGYGYSFWQKYGVPPPSSGAGEIDQILTEIFDYCRSLDPADDLVTTPYAATGQAASPSVSDGGAQVTPITINMANFGNLYSTKGFGRFDTIDQVSLDFTKSEAGAYNANGTADSTHVNIAGILYLSLYSPSEGYVSLNPHLRIVVQTPNSPGVITMNLIGSDGTKYPVFGSPNNGSNSGRTVFSVIPLPPNPGGNYNGWNNGNHSSLLWGGVSGARQLLLDKYATNYNKITYSGGVITSGVPSTHTGNYELCGLNIKIPTTCTSLSMAATPLEIKIYHTDASPSSTTAGDGYDGAAADLVQDITVQLPAFSGLPMPTNYAYEGWSTTTSSEQTYDLSTRLYQTAYCTQTYPVVAGSGSSGGQFIESGDVIQSLVAGYNGDSRLLAAQATINDTVNTGTLGSAPSPAFVQHPLYGTANEPSSGLAMAHSQLDIFPHWSQPGYTNPSAPLSGTTGQFVPAATYGSVIPVSGYINSALAGTQGAPDYTGDWDNGWGGFSDGPFINKADEAGSQYETTANETYGFDPYYNGEASSPYKSLSSPNRTVASPVMFGSLPTGVPLGKWGGTSAAPTYTPLKTVEAPNGQAIPWQTLLFHPQAGHYGGSNGGSTIEDEEMLDWFWMPQVEPYAISTTLATAGKVNMNYQIAPFTYITRATALMGVLGSEYVIAVPTTAGNTYKNGTAGTIYPSYRTPVKVLENDNYTLGDQSGTFVPFKQRFSNGQIFKSAAEICDIYLVPQGQSWTNWDPVGNPASPSTSDAEKFWANNKLTGDNTRERPYNGLYSRLTTKSNTYTVHMRAQALTYPSNATAGQWVENPQLIASEYRGSVTINRYLDPQDPNIPDFTATSNLMKYSLDSYYKYRVLETRRFLP